MGTRLGWLVLLAAVSCTESTGPIEGDSGAAAAHPGRPGDAGDAGDGVATDSGALDGSSDDGAAPAPERCRSQCELATSCVERGIDAFADLAATRAEWSGDCADQDQDAGPCVECSRSVVEGACASGWSFLQRSNGAVGEAYYFDEQGAFIGLATSTDDIDHECLGQGYWPQPIPCSEPRLTEVHCGSAQLTDPVRLPWADGAPIQ